jgi:hypothetical protein
MHQMIRKSLDRHHPAELFCASLQRLNQQANSAEVNIEDLLARPKVPNHVIDLRPGDGEIGGAWNTGDPAQPGFQATLVG